MSSHTVTVIPLSAVQTEQFVQLPVNAEIIGVTCLNNAPALLKATHGEADTANRVRFFVHELTTSTSFIPPEYYEIKGYPTNGTKTWAVYYDGRGVV